MNLNNLIDKESSNEELQDEDEDEESEDKFNATVVTKSLIVTTNVSITSSQDLKLLCLNRKFESITWKKGKFKINKLSKRLFTSLFTNKNVFVNDFDELEIKSPSVLNNGIYTCSINKIPILVIQLKISIKTSSADELNSLADGNYDEYNYLLVMFFSLVSSFVVLALVIELVNNFSKRQDVNASKSIQKKRFENIHLYIAENLAYYEYLLT